LVDDDYLDLLAKRLDWQLPVVLELGAASATGRH